MNLDYRMSKEQAKQQIQLFRTLYDDVKIEKAEQGKKDLFFQEVLEKKDQATRLEYAGEKILELTLRYAEIDASFAGVKVYLDQARIPSGNATIIIDSSFAGVELFVPKEWQIVNHVESSFGGIDEKNNRNGEVTATLTLEGSNNFGGITIYYV